MLIYECQNAHEEVDEYLRRPKEEKKIGKGKLWGPNQISVNNNKTIYQKADKEEYEVGGKLPTKRWAGNSKRELLSTIIKRDHLSETYFQI